MLLVARWNRTADKVSSGLLIFSIKDSAVQEQNNSVNIDVPNLYKEFKTAQILNEYRSLLTNIIYPDKYN